MLNPINVFFSNRTEFLYQKLKYNIYGFGNFFSKKIIIVPTKAMKSWLMFQLANDPEVGIAFGLKILQIDQALIGNPLPTTVEIALGIETEIRSSIWHDEVYQPLIDSLQLSNQEKSTKILSSRTNQRLCRLSSELAFLFQKYGKWGKGMLEKWKNSAPADWQHHLWKVVYQKHQWSVLFESGQQALSEIHLFCTSSICPLYYKWLTEIFSKKGVFCYLLSPCQFFWTDFSKFEKFGNPLLASLGELRRQTWIQIEESDALIDESYSLPVNASDMEFYQDYLTGNEILIKTADALTILETIQCDLLLIREGQSVPLKMDHSISVHVASNPLREIQIIYDQLLQACSCDNIKPGEICVLAKDIRPYEAYIQMVFGSGSFHYQISDGNLMEQNGFVQIVLFLFRLSLSRWDAPSLLRLFEDVRFQKKQGLSLDDVSLIRHWISMARITWGVDVAHRSAILRQNFGEIGIYDENPAGTWEYGFQRLLYGLALDYSEELVPLNCVETTEMELLGKWIALVRSLFNDLQPIVLGKTKSARKWVEYLDGLINKYFFPSDEEEIIQSIFQKLKNFNNNSEFPFSTILYQIESELEKNRSPYQDLDSNAIRFSTLSALCQIPFKVVVLLGLSDNLFPGKDRVHSLDRLEKNEKKEPSQVEIDRNFFLEALLSARTTLMMTYSTDGKEHLPSLPLSELIHYCDQNYLIENQKFSDLCVHTHPSVPYDPLYFNEASPIKSYSRHNFELAKIQLEKKKPPHRFIPSFKNEIAKNLTHCLVTLDEIKAFAKNPIRSYFRHTLGFIIKDDEQESLFKNEPFQLSNLERYQIRKEGREKPLFEVLSFAEREGRLPFGVFKPIEISRLQREVHKDLELRLQLGISDDETFTIELTEKVNQVCQVGNCLKIPPLKVAYSETLTMTIIGIFHDVTPNGFLVNLKDQPVDVLKAWPMFLILSNLIETYELPFKPDIIFLKDGKVQKPFLFDQKMQLSNYLSYYSRSLSQISPLIPEFVPDILLKKGQDMVDSLNQKLQGAFYPLYNNEIKWIFKKGTLIETALITNDWKKIAEDLYLKMYQQWYPKTF